MGTHTRAEQLERAKRFLKAVVPEAEKANVRLALHPNDPPVPLSRGSEQLMATVAHWKEYLGLVESPFNGMTFDCGVTREMGEDPVAVCRYLGERDRINHVHFRNVVVRKPYVDYTEVFLDDGQVDLFGVMRELVRQKYPRAIYPEHPRALDVDRERGRSGTSIRAAAASPARSTTSATRGPCCRRRSRSEARATARYLEWGAGGSDCGKPSLRLW